MENFLDNYGISEEFYREKVTSGEMFEDMPTKAGGYCEGEVPLDLELIDTTMTEYMERRDAIKSSVAYHDTPVEIRKQRFTGTCFVIFKSQTDMHKVMHDNKNVGMLAKCFPCCRLRRFERAPEPSDISWENIGIS